MQTTPIPPRILTSGSIQVPEDLPEVLHHLAKEVRKSLFMILCVQVLRQHMKEPFGSKLTAKAEIIEFCHEFFSKQIN
jgi:hypothetical protein